MVAEEGAWNWAVTLHGQSVVTVGAIAYMIMLNHVRLKAGIDFVLLVHAVGRLLETGAIIRNDSLCATQCDDNSQDEMKR